MAPKRAPATKKGKEAEQAGPSKSAPALGKARICNQEGLDKIRHLVADASNEWGKTRLWPGSTSRRELDVTAYPVFQHAIAAGLVAPFSPFFLAILEHYQIQLLHLHPNSITILAVFAFACEAFLGIKPSVALFHHYYSLRITAGNQSSGCVSFRAETTGKKEDG